MGSIAEGDNTYSLHRTGVGLCSNELEGVAFVSLGNFMRGGGGLVGSSRKDHALQ